MMDAGYGYLLFGLIGGVLTDILFGDPPNRYHPVSWLGLLINFFIPKLKGDKDVYSVNKEKIGGDGFRYYISYANRHHNPVFNIYVSSCIWNSCRCNPHGSNIENCSGHKGNGKTCY